MKSTFLIIFNIFLFIQVCNAQIFKDKHITFYSSFSFGHNLLTNRGKYILTDFELNYSKARTININLQCFINDFQQFHIVLETLDTEEATYLWHLHKDKPTLKIKLKEIDEQLSIIRNKGRQVFLTCQPKNFSRILHDYSDEKKGFIIWKDLLEEQIT